MAQNWHLRKTGFTNLITMIDPGLQNKVAIVTGTNNPMGIGAAITKALAKQGVKVVLHFYRIDPEIFGLRLDELENATAPGLELYYKNQTKSAEVISEEINKEGGQSIIFEADLSATEMIPILFDKAEKHFGPVDILINNASYDKPDSFLPESMLEKPDKDYGRFQMSTLTGRSFDRHFDINAKATALLTTEYTKRYVKNNLKSGCIVNMSSISATGCAGFATYSASKNAVVAYSKAAALELGQLGIRVNAISPGPVQTGWINEPLRKKFIKKSPLKRLGKPEDVARAAVFLCSQQSGWITGQVLKVDGGIKE